MQRYEVHIQGVYRRISIAGIRGVEKEAGSDLCFAVNTWERKVTKNWSLFPDDTSAMKLLYLATQEVLKKWTVKTRDWSKILAQLSIHFDDRLTKYL